ncbi:MAG: nucleotide pyrophosphohydrolase [Methanobacteriota archaeon]
MKARNWERFHRPKDVAIALSVEASELIERFLWRDAAPPSRIPVEERAGIADELADVLIYGLSLGNALGIDVSDAILAKIATNEARYPADRVRARPPVPRTRPP